MTWMNLKERRGRPTPLSLLWEAGDIDGLRARVAGGMNDDQHDPGWWVGSDGHWHAPDEDFNADVPKRSHPVRRVAIVLLAVAVVGATTVGAWLGAGSQTSGPATGGPSLGVLDAQVEQVVTGTGADGFGVTGVSDVVCGPAVPWRPGNRFECSVYASPQQRIGVYDGIVEPATSSGQWRWRGWWYPILRHSGTAQQL